jgi:type I restriction enzyme, S subunit
MIWEPRTLGSLLTKSGSDKAGERDLPVLSITMKYGLVNQSEKFKKRVASQDTSKYRVAYRNELVVGFPIDEGVLGFQTQYSAGIVSPAYDIWKLKNPTETHIPYLERYLRSTHARRIYASKMQGAVARRRSLTATDFLKLEIPLPPIADQKRIAYLLGKVEGLIAQRKQHLQQLDDLLKSVFLEMFGDPVRNEKGWAKETLGKLASSFKYGTNVKSDNNASNGIPVLRIPNVIGGKLDLTDIKYSNLDDAELEKTQLIAGDLLLVRTNGNPEYIGRSAVFDIAEDIYAYASYLIRVRLESADTIRSDFLNFVINFPSYRSSLVTRAKTTAGNYNINTASLKTLIIPLPPIDLQNQFATIVEKVEGIKSRYQASLTDLETLYGALSQKAFKGELDLSRVPLIPDGTEAPAAEPQKTNEPQPTTDPFNLPAPSDLATLTSAAGRDALLTQWLTAWLQHLNNTPFSTQPFIEAAQQRLWQLAEDDALELGAADYDQIKVWTSQSLDQGRLAQTYNDVKNRVQLQAVSH